MKSLQSWFRRSPATSQPSVPDEQAARALAEAAVGRRDLAAALAGLAPWEGDAQAAPVTSALLAHVLLSIGQAERARAVLDLALRAHPREAILLETQARLYDYLDDALSLYRSCKQRLLLGGIQPRHLVQTLRALVQVRAGGASSTDEGLRLVKAMFAQQEALATPHECLEFAEHLYRIPGQEEEAAAIVARRFPPPKGMRDQTVARASATAQATALGERAVWSGDGGEAGLLTLNDALVLAGLNWSPCIGTEAPAVIDEFMTVKPVMARDRASSPMLLRGPRHMLLRLPDAPPQRVSQPCVLLGGGDSSNYYHFIHEHLSRLAVLETLGIDFGDAMLVVGEGVAEFQRAYFALLGISSERLLEMPSGAVWRFSRLLAPLPPGRGGTHTDPLLVRWARDRLVPAAGGVRGQGRKLLLSRALTSRRRIANEEELFALMAPAGYELVHPERLSVAEQVALFAQASHIAGSGGAALTNMIFMPPGGRVLMFNNRYIPPHARNLFFEPLARACGHEFTILSGEPVAFPTERAIDADIRIDLAAAQALLRAHG